MASCRGPGSTNSADKNPNVKISVTIIMFLLQYPSILRTTAYLMPEHIKNHSKPSKARQTCI